MGRRRLYVAVRALDAKTPWVDIRDDCHYPSRTRMHMTSGSVAQGIEPAVVTQQRQKRNDS